jgi:hypothetical protein
MHIGAAEGCGQAEEVVQAPPHCNILGPLGQDVVLVRPGQAVAAEQGLGALGDGEGAAARHS